MGYFAWLKAFFWKETYVLELGGLLQKSHSMASACNGNGGCQASEPGADDSDMDT